ncbi:MAG: glycosyltransferase [Halochromatium sp.]|nr:glycosyltransferase [Halochromatium sp.]
MKIAIVAPSAVPFLVGGAEKLWWGLLSAINQHTEHHAELIKLPSPEQDVWSLIDSYRAFSQLRLDHFDLVISTKYPAWMVAHPNHVCYLQHKLRGLYDTYHFSGLPTALPRLPRALQPLRQLLEDSRGERAELKPLFAELERLRTRYALADLTQADSALVSHFQLPSPLVRRIVHCLDHIGLAPDAIQRYLAISRTVAEREDYFPPGAEVEVLHHPSDLPRAECTGYQDVFTASRLDHPKRLHLLIDAFRQVETDRHFRIAGTGPAEAELRARAQGDPRIQFLGHISDEQIIAEYGRALFVPFVPYDEDYGLITLEAMRAAKPVLTTTDAGGVNELVEHGRSGLSVAPQAGDLAGAMRQLIDDPAATQAMGETARDRVAGIDWPQTLAALLRPSPSAPPRRRFKLVVAVDFPVYPPRGGGQARIYHLYRALARQLDVVLVSLCDDPARAGRYSLAPGLIEQRIAKSESHLRSAQQLDAKLGVSAGDIATLIYQQQTPAYAEALAVASADCDLLIASHPYLYPSIESLSLPRLWYEAHNVEWDMKRAVLGETATAMPYLQRVAETERRLCQRAERVLVCAGQDATRLAELYGIEARNCIEVPNGVALDGVPFTDYSQRQQSARRLGLDQRPSALFIGSWHQPNIEAVAALKPVAEQLPGVDFLIVGSVCKHPVMQQRPANLYPLGILSDDELALLLEAVRLALNPVTSGSGTNLKMLHYAAAGIPILSTPFGNRSLRLRDGEHLWCAELPVFARQIPVILDAETEQQERVRAARRCVERGYDWPIIAARLHSALSPHSLLMPLSGVTSG